MHPARRFLDLYAACYHGSLALANDRLGSTGGDMPLPEPAPEMRFDANQEMDIAIRARASTTSFGQALLDAGMTAVALDDSGVLMQHYPDGTSRPLEGS
jgi:hypothetical protein